MGNSYCFSTFNLPGAANTPIFRAILFFTKTGEIQVRSERNFGTNWDKNRVRYLCATSCVALATGTLDERLDQLTPPVTISLLVPSSEGLIRPKHPEWHELHLPSPLGHHGLAGESDSLFYRLEMPHLELSEPAEL